MARTRVGVRLPRRAGGERRQRRRLAVYGLVVVASAVARAGVGGAGPGGGIGAGIVNTRGWPSFARFWTSVTSPVLDRGFLGLTVEAAVTTVAVAVLGTAVSLVIGAVGSVALSRLLWGDGPLPRLVSVLFAVPRAAHEVLWALVLVQVLGFDPLVAVIAIGVPFGAVTAKVFAETFDEADRAPFAALRASGAGGVAALVYGVVPGVRGELTSYAFYRFECALRSAAVLGVVGLGGLGYQLDLSFQTLRYGEMWTLLGALVVLTAGAEGVSTLVRRAQRSSTGGGGPAPATVTIAGIVTVGIVAAWSALGLDPARLWAPRTIDLAGDLVADLWPPSPGRSGWWGLADATVDTLAMSVLALALAVVVALVVTALVTRPGPGVVSTVSGTAVALFARAVPAPVWAFLAVLVLFPGPWPGAVALGVYEAGVLTRLFAETVRERDRRPSAVLVASGAGPVAALAYGDLAAAAPRLAALALYRWEVVVRETVMVGVVGAGGLGQLVRDDLAARDLAAVATVAAVFVGLTVVVDAASAVLRRGLR